MRSATLAMLFAAILVSVSLYGVLFILHAVMQNAGGIGQ